MFSAVEVWRPAVSQPFGVSSKIGEGKVVRFRIPQQRATPEKQAEFGKERACKQRLAPSCNHHSVGPLPRVDIGWNVSGKSKKIIPFFQRL